MCELADGSEQRFDMSRGIELAETDPHGSSRKSSDRFVRCRGAMEAGSYRNAKFLVEQGASESHVLTIEAKRDDAGARRPTHHDVPIGPTSGPGSVQRLTRW